MPDLARVHITRDAVYFDGVRLPDYIARQGVSFTPGGADVNRLTIEFLVGDVVCDDPTMVTGMEPTPIYDALAREWNLEELLA